jgi:hypothetical protein
MSEDLGEGTITGEHDAPKVKSPNTKIHGEVPPGSPMPGAEEPDSAEVKKEINPNTE